MNELYLIKYIYLCDFFTYYLLEVVIIMLVRFSVGNFLSFKEVQEFSLIKGKAKSKSERVFETDKVRLLKFAALFGANASGKSNLVSSIKYAQAAIVRGLPKKGKISAFKLDSDYKNKPSYFEFEIYLNESVYSYGFEIILSRNELVSEWLFELSASGTDKIIFARDIANEGFTSDLIIKSKEIRNKFGVYSDDLKSNFNVLFLSEMNRAKDELYKNPNELTIFKDVYDWFARKLDVNYPDAPVSGYSYFRDTNNKEEVCRIIRSLGTGITNYLEVKSSIDQLQKNLPKPIFERLESDLKDLKIAQEKGMSLRSISIRFNDMYYVISTGKDEEIDVTTIAFNHGSDVIFDFSEESDGTRRILDLIEILFSEPGKVYVIDEIDRSLHPQLTYKLIQEFLNVARKRNVQLIITTHESRLLDFGLLRQDEIWISNKNAIGATELYSLDEYNVRFDKKVDKAYLEGRYGGVPIFSSIFPIEEDRCDANT